MFMTLGLVGAPINETARIGIVIQVSHKTWPETKAIHYDTIEMNNFDLIDGTYGEYWG